MYLILLPSTWYLLCIYMNPNTSVYIHMHPSRIRMHPYICLHEPPLIIRTPIFNTCLRRRSRKVKQVSKSESYNCVRHRKIVPNPTQFSKFIKNGIQQSIVFEIYMVIPFVVFFPRLSRWSASFGRCPTGRAWP